MRETRATEPDLLRPASARPLRLLVIASSGSSSSVSLPLAGEVVMGRAEGCDVILADPSISRRHACLRLGAELELVDLGSSNGTYVDGRRLAPGEAQRLHAGRSFALGGATILIQQSPVSQTLRPVRSHDYFTARLEDECARCEATLESFVVVRARAQEVSAAMVEQQLWAMLRPTDVLASSGALEYEMLLFDEEESSRARAAELERAVALAGGTLALGLAVYPTDGASAQTLLGAADDDASGVTREPRLLRTSSVRALEPVVARLAAGEISVLIQGETGVGKELLAHWVHRLSRRAAGPLVTVNCSAFSEALFESELFGYERGAFTGAVKSKAGLIETASGGTLFLDEVAELPLAMQAKLLRVLEQRETQRLGSLRPKRVDVRFVAATNRDLQVAVEGGSFRRDLYFRLAGASITVPPLRERRDEIEALASSFIQETCRQLGRSSAPSLAAAALVALREHHWPGNVRELRNVIERAVLLCQEGVIELEHLPLPPAPAEESLFSLSTTPVEAFRAREVPTLTSGLAKLDLTRELRAARVEAGERKRILAALERCAGNQSHAAKLLGVSRRTLINRIEQYGLPRPRKR